MSDNINENQTVLEEAASKTSEAPKPTAKVSRSIPRVWWGLAVGGAFALGIMILAIASKAGIIAALIMSLFTYTFVASLFFEDSTVRDVLFWMCTKSIRFPGLIWEFSIDGFIWLIAMKLLFAVIGFLFGVICAILGVIISILISPFCYPFNLISYIREN